METPSVPQAIESEQRLLATVLLQPELFDRVVDRLDTEDFYSLLCGRIFNAIRELAREHKPIDFVTCKHKLKDQGQFSDEAWKLLLDMNTSSAQEWFLEYDCNRVKERANLRKLLKISRKITERCQDETQDFWSLTADFHKEVDDLASFAAPNAAPELHELTEDYLNWLTLRALKKDEISGVPSGLNVLDALLDGFQDANVVVVAARPGMGKTSLVLNIAENAALDYNVPVTFFSLEMSGRELVGKLMASRSEVPANQLRGGHVNDACWSSLREAKATLDRCGLSIIDNSSKIRTVSDISARVKQQVAKGKKPGLIIIDYIQLLQGKRKENRTVEVSDITRDIKLLAGELGVPILALSQLSRTLESRQNKRPVLSDLRDSGSVEQDADVVIFIYRDDYYNKESDKRGEAELIIAKQRNGETGTVEVLYQSSITKFLNKAEPLCPTPKAKYSKYLKAEDPPPPAPLEEKEAIMDFTPPEEPKPKDIEVRIDSVTKEMHIRRISTNEEKHVWTEAKCMERMSQLLQEANGDINSPIVGAFWASSIKMFEHEDELRREWGSQCYERLVKAWDEVCGIPLDAAPQAEYDPFATFGV